MKAKSCPFCGGERLGIHIVREDERGRKIQVCCEDCKARGPLILTREDALLTCTDLACEETGWNNRVGKKLFWGFANAHPHDPNLNLIMVSDSEHYGENLSLDVVIPEDLYEFLYDNRFSEMMEAHWETSLSREEIHRILATNPNFQHCPDMEHRFGDLGDLM